MIRFGKRNKGPLSWPRRSRERETEAFEPVASEERRALLGDTSAPDSNVRPPETQSGQTEHVYNGDPVQVLLTALGRFKRQLTHAEDGAPQSEWSDECMVQLINAVEVAVSEGWKEIVEAITDTGRVLQTYEDAGRAGECVGFLTDSHEILCLMAGDLIVGKVRGGVVRKWRERFQEALADLEAAGLTLITEDGEPSEREAAAPGPADSSEDAASLAAPSASNESDDALSPSIEDAFPSLEQDPRTYDIDPEPGEESSDSVAAASEEASAPIENEEETLPPDVVAVLDAYCDGLMLLQDDPGDAFDECISSMEGSLRFLRDKAIEMDWHGSVTACDAMTSMLRHVSGSRADIDEHFLEVAFAFSGIYGEAKERPRSESVQEWMDESSALIENWIRAREESLKPRDAVAQPEMKFSTEPEYEDEAVTPEREHESNEQPPVTDPSDADEDTDDIQYLDERDEALSRDVHTTDDVDSDRASPGIDVDDEESPERLLISAQELALRGRVGDAKMMALRAALGIARNQVLGAGQRVRDTETRFRESIEKIQRTRAAISKAEEAVAESETSIARSEIRVQERQAQCQTVHRHLTMVEREIQDIESRIAELQRQREEAESRRQEVDRTLAETRQSEADARSELEQRREALHGARLHLANTRLEIKTLERLRQAIEAEVDRTREAHIQEQESLADIERTLEQIGNVRVGRSEGQDNLLF